jgi:hypothetical protein
VEYEGESGSDAGLNKLPTSEGKMIKKSREVVPKEDNFVIIGI